MICSEEQDAIEKYLENQLEEYKRFSEICRKFLSQGDAAALLLTHTQEHTTKLNNMKRDHYRKWPK